MMNSTVRMMYLTKRLVSLLLLLGLLSFFCSCDQKDMPDDSITLDSEMTESQPSESDTEATSGNETENEPESDTEEGSETETVSGSETDTAPDTPDTSDEETTSPVVELPKVEFD